MLTVMPLPLALTVSAVGGGAVHSRGGPVTTTLIVPPTWIFPLPTLSVTVLSLPLTVKVPRPTPLKVLVRTAVRGGVPAAADSEAIPPKAGVRGAIAGAADHEAVLTISAVVISAAAAAQDLKGQVRRRC